RRRSRARRWRRAPWRGAANRRCGPPARWSRWPYPMGSMPPPMGQPITVVEKASTTNPAILRLETNRPLSGMGHERYHSPPGELLQRPVDELARRLLAAGGVEGVHIHGSVVTVTLGGGQPGAGLAATVRKLLP